jgi:hypothetical protein
MHSSNKTAFKLTIVLDRKALKAAISNFVQFLPGGVSVVWGRAITCKSGNDRPQYYVVDQNP